MQNYFNNLSLISYLAIKKKTFPSFIIWNNTSWLNNSSSLKLFLYNIMGATSCPSWLNKLNFLYVWWVFKKSEDILWRLAFRKVVVLNTNYKCCHASRTRPLFQTFCTLFISTSEVIPVVTAGKHAHNLAVTEAVNDPASIQPQTLEGSRHKARLSLNAPLTATCRCFPVNIDADGSPPAEPFLTEVFRLVTAVVSGASLKSHLTRLTEVSGKTAASGGAVPVPVSRSTRIPVPALSPCGRRCRRAPRWREASPVLPPNRALGFSPDVTEVAAPRPGRVHTLSLHYSYTVFQ